MNSLYVSPLGNDGGSGSPESPLKTLSAALDRVKILSQTDWDGPFTVTLRGGVYPLTKPLSLSLRAPVTIRGCEGETAVLDGGRALEGITQTLLNGKRCWTCPVKEDEEFNSLFADGVRRARAALPKNGFYRIESVPGQQLQMPYRVPSDKFVAKPGTVFPARNLTDAVIHVYHYWSDEELPLKSYDPETRLAVTSIASDYTLHDDNGKEYAKYRVENLFEGLTDEGDWYLDRREHLLYYLPFEGEEIGKTVLTVPVCDRLLELNGCADVRLENLCFSTTDCRNSVYNVAGQGASRLHGAITFENCERCALINCRVERVGSYCVDVRRGCRSIEISRCVLRDMAAGGVKISGADAKGPEGEVTHHIRVTDCLICEGGREFLAGIGVLSMHAHHVLLSHNEIHDLYYTGISCGWVWGYAPSVSHDNTIEYNHIYDIGHGVLSDMGGIYTLGVQPGTVIRNNLVHDVERANYGGWAIYPDEGSSHILIENNVSYNTASACFHQHYGRENIVRNNVFAFGHEGIVACTRHEDHVGFTLERNILLTDGQSLFVNPGIAGIRSDMNLYWDVSGRPLTVRGVDNDPATERPAEAMHEQGCDLFCLTADPLFRDPAKGDFTLDEDSPAFLIGFVPIDMSTVGIRR